MWKILPKLLLGSLLTVLVVLLTSLPVSISSAHSCKPDCSPTPTPTITPSPTPVVKACQVAEIIFLERFEDPSVVRDAYQTGETIRVRVEVTDYYDQPLVGAKVVAEVNREPLSAQASTGSGSYDLEDQSGSYDGAYDKTELPGLYHFSFTVSDPTGERFLPCSGEATVPVTEDGNGKPECAIELAVNPLEVTVGGTFQLTATVTNTNGADAEVTVAVQTPGGVVPPFPLPGSGATYSGSYADTTAPGEYRFQATAEDPSGESFIGCESEWESGFVSVLPVETTLRVVPETLETDLCDLTVTSAVNVENVSNLAEVELEIIYDPAVIQVLDADYGQRGVQIRVGNIFATGTIVENMVDTGEGRISFVARRLDGFTHADPIGMIAIDWRPVGVGTSPVAFENEKVVLRDISGQEIDVTSHDGTVEVAPVFNCRTGVVMLEGRDDHSGVVITNSVGEQTQTEPDGYFAIAGGDIIDVEFPSYLSAQADVTELSAIEQVEGKPLHLGTMTLLAGDIDGDDLVNILDLATVAGSYLTTDPLADLNADGVVNIFDLVLVATNYQQQGPLTAWQ